MKRKTLAFILSVAVMCAFLLYPGNSIRNASDSENSPSGIGTLNAYAAELSGDKLSNAVVLYVGSSVAFVNNKETLIDTDAPELTPISEGGNVFVPIRFVSENLKASLNWNGNKKTVTVRYQDKAIVMTQDKREMTVNGNTSAMDAAVKNKGGRIFVPLRSLTQAMGKEVFYDRGLIVISDVKDILDAEKDRAYLDEVIAKVNALPTIGSMENLTKMLSELLPANDRGIMLYDKEVEFEASVDMKSFAGSASTNSAASDMAAGESAPAATMAPTQSAQAETQYDSKYPVPDASADFSKTNTQVQGVDEGDIIKTDGTYLYYANGQEVAVVKAIPAGEMKLMSRIKFDDASFSPSEMYVDGNTLIVTGQTYRYATGLGRSMPYGGDMAKVYVFDTSDKSNIKKVRELESSGRLVSSRKIGNALYFVSNYYIYYYNAQDDIILPCYRDSKQKDDYVEIRPDRISYFPKPQESVFTTVTGVDLSRPDKNSQVYTYFGGGEKLYVSSKNMYVASASYDYMSTGGSTTLYKFSLNNGGITYLCKGEAPGRILNQFSMDENGKYFRIATTEYDSNWQMSNSMYVLDETLNVVGSIKDIAPTEQIYSVRFMGNRAYMVTFRVTDPLYTIDLTDPKNPKILGALKIPGYSDYLHPYDENHLIGFGKDTMERYGTAYYLGMKISMFDVTDVNNPKELFTSTIGDRGTESPLLYNHKALLFSKEKNILAFPVTVHKSASDDPLEYGAFEFQGAYVYSIDMNKGFQLNGKITHLSTSDYRKAGMYGGDYEKSIERILYIGDNLYSASQKKIMANSITNLKEVGSVEIK